MWQKLPDTCGDYTDFQKLSLFTIWLVVFAPQKEETLQYPEPLVE